MKFDDFIQKYNFKIKTTSNIKIEHVLPSLSLNGLKIYFRDDLFSGDIGIVNFPPIEELIGFFI